MKKFQIGLGIILLLLCLTACSFGKKKGGNGGDPYATDQMFNEERSNEEIYIFRMGDSLYTVDHIYELRIPEIEMTKDGGFYKLTADVTYLNGGVAGYVNFPEIKRVLGCEEISPLDLDLPSITESWYGLVFIGDYADGDIFLNEYNKMALWKDGSFIYQYDKTMKGDDGTLICMRSDVTEEVVKEGIRDGVLSCEDYFVLPAKENSSEP